MTRKKIFRDSALIILITICFIELLGIFVGNNDYFWKNRQIMIPDQTLRTVGNKGLWTYKPHITVDSAATYFLSKNNGWLEYRCQFNTNKFGLVETNYDNQKTVDWLVLGDSFTEGQGGCSWLSKEKLAAENYSKIVINGGLQGTGIQSFKLLSDWLEAQVKIKNILVIAISNDFKREVNKNLVTENQGEVTALKLSDEEMLKAGAEAYQKQNKTLKAQIDDSLRYYSATYRFAHKIGQRFSKKKKSAPAADSQVFEKNLTALRQLRKKYPQLKVMLITQKDEVGLLGRKNGDTQLVEKFLNEEQFNFSRCELDLADYLKIDGHPNKQGYTKVFECFRAATN